MVRRGKEIKIVVHTPLNLSAVFCAENIEEFWIEKISAKMRKSGFTKQEWQDLLERGKTGERCNVLEECKKDREACLKTYC